MNEPSQAPVPIGAAADGVFNELQQLANDVRSELARLRTDFAEEHGAFNDSQEARLLEANERLLCAALHAESVAEHAANELKEVSRASQFDVLTQTPNRALMVDRLNHALAMSRRHGSCLAVLFLDLNGFKQINDSLGHASGDHVLQVAARRLESVVRESDTVSRHGGDEFVVLLPEMFCPADVTPIVQKMLAALAEPFDVGGRRLGLSGSIGIALFPQDAEDPDTLIDRADAAMYTAKRQGQPGYAFAGAVPARHGVHAGAESTSRRGVVSHAAPPGQQASLANDLREANETLLSAALLAQELLSAAENAQRRHVQALAIAARELRHPLEPIRTAAQLLDHVTDPQLQQLKEIIERQVGHMTLLIDSLLIASRTGNSNLELARSHVPVAGILERAAKACQPVLRSRQQRFSFTPPPPALKLYCDPLRLQQAFDNLLDNASKYTPVGGSIRLSARTFGDKVSVVVRDNGIGIPAEALPHIFDPFPQGAQSSATDADGLSIGLSVVRELVQAHGGTVKALSAGPNQGSTFIVTLPLPEPAQPASPATEDRASGKSSHDDKQGAP